MQNGWNLFGSLPLTHIYTLMVTLKADSFHGIYLNETRNVAVVDSSATNQIALFFHLFEYCPKTLLAQRVANPLTCY